MTEWISVKDRLPESGTVVLLLCEIRGYCGAQMDEGNPSTADAVPLPLTREAKSDET